MERKQPMNSGKYISIDVSLSSFSHWITLLQLCLILARLLVSTEIDCKFSNPLPISVYCSFYEINEIGHDLWG